MTSCKRCAGSGWLSVRDYDDPETGELRVTCATCLGLGKVVEPEAEPAQLIERTAGGFKPRVGPPR